ncbi:hypothetical protein N8B89_09320 [Enterococcus faecium]
MEKKKPPPHPNNNPHRKGRKNPQGQKKPPTPKKISPKKNPPPQNLKNTFAEIQEEKIENPARKENTGAYRMFVTMINTHDESFFLL